MKKKKNEEEREESPLVLHSKIPFIAMDPKIGLRKIQFLIGFHGLGFLSRASKPCNEL